MRLLQTQVRLSILGMLLESMMGTVTTHVSTKQGLSFQLLLERVISHCAELLMRMGPDLGENHWSIEHGANSLRKNAC